VRSDQIKERELNVSRFIIPLIFVVMALVSQGQTVNDSATLVAQKADWPKEVSIVKSVKAELYTAEGKKVGQQSLVKGQKFQLRGVYSMGVGLRMGKMIAFVPPSATDISERIKMVQRYKDLTMERPRPDR